MHKKQSLSLAVALCLSAGLSQSLAAESFAQIKSLKGDAMVTQGERFVTAREGMALQQLDRIVVLEQGGAVIEFSDGCQYQMQEMELLTVGSKSACTAKTDYQGVQQTATSQIRAKPNDDNDCADWKPSQSGKKTERDERCAAWRKSGAGAAGVGAAGAGTAAGTGTAAGVGAAAGATGTGVFGGTLAGLGAATGLGTAGVIGVGVAAAGALGVAVNEATKSEDASVTPPISPD